MEAREKELKVVLALSDEFSWGSIADRATLKEEYDKMA